MKKEEIEKRREDAKRMLEQYQAYCQQLTGRIVVLNEILNEWVEESAPTEEAA